MPSIRWFERALAAQPGNLDIRIDLAATLGDAGRAKAALGVLRGEGGQAVGHPRGEFIQGVIAARGGKFSLARDFLERSGLGKEGVASALLLSAIIDIHEGNFDSAAQTLDRLYGRQPDNGRVVDLLALALSRGGSEAELVHRFEKRAAGPAGSNYLRTLVGRAYEAMDDRVSASRFLDLAAQGSRGLSALPISGGLPEERDRIRSAIARGQSVDALRQARAFARQFPGSCDALALLGDALLVSGNREEAAQAYSKSAKVRKPWPLVPRMASSVNGKAAARYMLEDFVVANPLNGEAAAMLSDAYALEGQWTRAAALLDHAMSLGHGRVPWVLSARSIAAAHLGESEEALQYAIAANSLQPMNQSAVRALLGSLPREQVEARAELSTKLRSLGRR
ncbi:tetratricopeptide repeat protein [Qipengyuania sp. RANM35]|uniref:tetratricopeptide repeat protein n=1 Tax=Qipengyuania sp. RANM35 TaxID=3068635 RepID=UPI0034DB62F9